jgi:hypothetical protein
MLRPLVALAALLLSCAVFAQGAGLKPKPSTDAGQAPATKSDQAPAASSVEVPPASPEESNAGVESVEQIFACLAAGLPTGWRSATVEVIEIASSGAERQFEAKYSYTRTLESKPLPLEPCDATGPAKSVHALNDFLEPEKRQWKRAKLTFNSDGKFELKYDYSE